MAASALDGVQVGGCKVVTRDNEIGVRRFDRGTDRGQGLETAVTTRAMNRGTDRKSIAVRAYNLHWAPQIRKGLGNSHWREPEIGACEENRRLQDCYPVGQQAKASTSMGECSGPEERQTPELSPI
jgi:hypothetical protein